MIIFVALLVSAALMIIAVLHAYWAFGGYWPAKDLASLPNTVIGQKGPPAMPPVAITLLVAVLIGGAALFPLFWIIGVGPQLWLQVGLALLFLVFGLRGIAGYLPWFTKTLTEEPFATLNRLYYSPLCLILAAGFGVLLLT